MAPTTAFLIGNSPDLETKEPKRALGFLFHSSGIETIFPARRRPQVDAFTKTLSALFKCSIQAPSDSFSDIIRSLVFLSGILSIDSAKHIRATPSLLSSPYSLRNASSLVLSLLLSLQASIIFFAF